MHERRRQLSGTSRGYDMDFETAFKFLIGHEGGYVNNPTDPGGETKYGISKRAYPAEDIKNLTLDRAKFLYKRDYWGPSGCELAPDLLKFHLFDFGVNSGPKTAVKILQGIVGEVQDGAYGPRTTMAVNNYNLPTVLFKLTINRLEYMTTLDNWPHAGKGWARRMCKNLTMIVEDTL